MADSNNKQKTIVESRRREEEEGTRAPCVRLDRKSDLRKHPGSRQRNGDRDRSPIRGAGDGEGEAPEPQPSTSTAVVDGAGEAEVTRIIRTRSGGKYTPAPSEEDEDGADSDASVDSIKSARSNCSTTTTASTKRKRGRPPTNGEYMGLAEAKRQYVEACEAEERVAEVEAILDPAMQIRRPSKGSKPLPDEVGLARDYRQRPTADVAAAVLESQQEVERVASVSKGLQGGFVRALRIAALSTRTAVMELASRSATATTKLLEEQNHRLQQEVTELKAELAKLRQEFSNGFQGRHQDNSMPPPPVPPPRAPGRKTPTPRLMSPCRASGEGGDAEPASLEERIFLRLSSLMDAKLERIGKKMDESREGELTTSREGGSTTSRGVDIQLSKGGRSTTARVGGSTIIRGAGSAQEDQLTTSPSAPASVSEKTKKNDKGRKGDPASIAVKSITLPVTKKKGPLPMGATAATEDIQPKETWAKVVGRKEKRKEKAATTTSNNTTIKPTKKKEAKSGGKGCQSLPARPPRTAAVTVTAPAGGNMSLEQIMATVTAKVKLAEVGIVRLRPRPALNGGLILEVPGQDGATKADKLATKMSEALEGTGARVARPVKKAELRVRGLIPSTTPADVAEVIAEVGGCRTEEVQTGEIRKASSGLSTLWIRCPAAAARKVAVQRKIVVGWMEVTVEALQARPLQCYKCLEVGHTREQCPSETDRSGRCYKCGDPSHKANICTAPPKCPVCTDKGRPAGHRLGGRACSAKTGSKEKGGQKKGTGAKAAALASNPDTNATGSSTTSSNISTVEKEKKEEQPPTAGPAGPEVDMGTAE